MAGRKAGLQTQTSPIFPLYLPQGTLGIQRMGNERKTSWVFGIDYPKWVITLKNWILGLERTSKSCLIYKITHVSRWVTMPLTVKELHAYQSLTRSLKLTSCFFLGQHKLYQHYVVVVLTFAINWIVSLPNLYVEALNTPMWLYLEIRPIQGNEG